MKTITYIFIALKCVIFCVKLPPKNAENGSSGTLEGMLRMFLTLWLLGLSPWFNREVQIWLPLPQIEKIITIIYADLNNNFIYG